MNSTSRLFRTGYRDIYTTDRDALFASAMRENVSFHYEHCEGYRRILDDAGFMPDRIISVDDLADRIMDYLDDKGIDVLRTDLNDDYLIIESCLHQEIQIIHSFLLEK